MRSYSIRLSSLLFYFIFFSPVLADSRPFFRFVFLPSYFSFSLTSCVRPVIFFCPLLREGVFLAVHVNAPPISLSTGEKIAARPVTLTDSHAVLLEVKLHGINMELVLI